MSESGTHFGGYRLSSRIATGGMAEVYLARRIQPDGSLGRNVALKRLLPHLVRESNIVRMFLNEARITAQIHHQNVVRIVDIGHQDGEPFIAMELLEGRSFAEVRQKAATLGERVPLGITLRVLADACRGLDAAHRAVDQEGHPLSIVHRDFSPDNIHVGVSGEVKVIDFGIAKADNLGSGTEPGTLKGKFFYMSPEMILGRTVDHRADLFAAGVMMYEQLCGRRPFTGETTDQVLTRIAEGKPRRPSEFDPSVPPELEQICLTALAREAAQRFDSLELFIQAIEAVGGRGELAPQEAVGAYVRRVFPDNDPKREALRRAMELDPSNPGAKAPGQLRDRPRTPRPAAPAPVQLAQEAASTRADRPAPAPLPAPAPVEGVGIRIPAEAEPAPVPARRLPLRTVAIVVAALLVAGGAAYQLTRPGAAPPERLLQAQRAADEGQRASLVAALAADERATADQLAEAGALVDGEALGPVAGALIKRFPSDVRGPLLEARSAITQRQAKRAETAITQAATLAPTSPQPQVLLAQLREAQGDVPAAVAALARARELSKQPSLEAELAGRQGMLLSQASDLEGAADALSFAIGREFDATLAAELGFVRFRQDRVGEARTLLNRAVRKDPGDFLTRYYLGAVLFRQGDVAGAEREYREADRLSPQDPRALAALCEVQAKGGKAEEAEATRKALGSRFPEQASRLLAGCAP